MKKMFVIAIATCCTAAGAFAQKQSEPLPYNKQYLDSLFRNWPKSNEPFVLPVPKGYTPPANLFSENPKSFEASNAGMAKEAINLKWQEFMGPFFDSIEGRPDENMMNLEEVFHTD